MSNHQRDTIETALWVLIVLGAAALLSFCGCGVSSGDRVQCAGPRDISCNAACVVTCEEIPGDDAGVFTRELGTGCAGAEDCRQFHELPDGGWL